MEKQYQTYIDVLRAFVQGTSPSEMDVKSLIELARINSTMGILCHMGLSHAPLTDPALRVWMRRQCLAEIAQFSRRTELAKAMAVELDKQGIDFILFKGLVVREYYPVPELRTFGDVDLIIRKEDRQKSDALMLSLGYERKEDWEPSYSYRKSSEYYELHSRVIGFDVSDRADFVSYFEDIWSHTRPAQVVDLPHARELTPEFHFLYLLTHLAKHISASGAGIRMYLDLAFFIKHFGDTLNWMWVRQEVEKLSLTDFANVALAAVERWFGVASPIALAPVEEAMLDDFTDFTIAGGVYGYVGREKGEVFLKQQNRNGEEVSKCKTLLHHAFPSAKVLVNKYTYLERCPWLLPVAWFQRLVDKRKEWSRFATHTREILTADEEKVLKLKRIYQQIGL